MSKETKKISVYKSVVFNEDYIEDNAEYHGCTFYIPGKGLSWTGENVKFFQCSFRGERFSLYVPKGAYMGNGNSVYPCAVVEEEGSGFQQVGGGIEYGAFWSWTDLKFHGCVVHSIPEYLKGNVFEECIFKEDFNLIELEECTFINCIFDNGFKSPELIGCKFDGCTFNKTFTIERDSMVKQEIFNTVPKNTFEDCNFYKILQLCEEFCDLTYCIQKSSVREVRVLHDQPIWSKDDLHMIESYLDSAQIKFSKIVPLKQEGGHWDDFENAMF